MSSGWQEQFQAPQWRTTPSSPNFTAIHMCHLRTRKVLMWGFGESGGTAATYRTPEARLWTPPPLGAPQGEVGTFQSVPNTRTNLLCAGHSFLDDGRLFCAGGHFNPQVPDPIPPGTRREAGAHADGFNPPGRAEAGRGRVGRQTRGVSGVVHRKAVAASRSIAHIGV
ncbi:MAG: hypothetical protein FJ255_01145 [Phycisphaerae bacterium]|nr:hypothetical protein [Phycisphaerae bacterium]